MLKGVTKLFVSFILFFLILSFGFLLSKHTQIPYNLYVAHHFLSQQHQPSNVLLQNEGLFRPYREALIIKRHTLTQGTLYSITIISRNT